MTGFMRFGSKRRQHRNIGSAAPENADPNQVRDTAERGRGAFETSCFDSSLDLLRGLEVEELPAFPDDWAPVLQAPTDRHAQGAV